MPVHPVRATRLRRAWYDSPWRIAGRAVSCAVTILLVALTVALAVVPKLTGGTTLTVLTGSMEPTLSPGDVAVVRGIDVADVCAEVAVGDIITFFPTTDDPSLITHRVVGKSVGSFEDGTSCRLLTQGDANSAADDPVSPEQVRGVFLYGLPRLGQVREWAGEHTQALLVAGAAALIGWGLWSTLRRPRTRVVALTTVPGPGSDHARPTEGPSRSSEHHASWPDPWAVDPRHAGRHPEGRRPAGPHDGGPVQTDPCPPAAPGTGPSSTDLRERELALRELELALRERELELAARQAEAARAAAPAADEVDR